MIENTMSLEMQTYTPKVNEVALSTLLRLTITVYTIRSEILPCKHSPFDQSF